jgi:purine-nucleoside phosphorylase
MLNGEGIESAAVMVTLGSGQKNPWSDEVVIQLEYTQIPGWPAAAVEGHAGRLNLVHVGAENVLVMEGRHHYYESRSYDGVIAPLRISRALGVDRVVLTNSVGSLHSELQAGDLMLVSDHLFFQGPELQTLLGSETPFGQEGPYWKEGGQLVRDAAVNAEIELKEGILFCVQGPMYETGAEAEMARRMGADVVAMSLAPEAMIATAFGCRVIGLSLVTNSIGVSVLAGPNHNEVISAAAMYQSRLDRMLKEVVPVVAAAVGWMENGQE